MPFWVMVAIVVAQYVISSLLAPKPGDVEAERPEAPQIDQSRPVPVFWGTVKITDPTVIDYLDTKVEPIKKKYFNGLWFAKRIVGHKYYAGLALRLGFGRGEGVDGGAPSVRLYGIEVDNKVAWEGEYAASVEGTSVDKPTLFGGEEDQDRGGVKFTFDFYRGDQTTANPYLVARRGASPSYFPISYLVIRGASQGSGYLGKSPTLPPIAVIVGRFPLNVLGGAGFSNRVGPDLLDANPVEVVHDILINKDWGMGEAAANIDSDGAGSSFYEAALVVQNGAREDSDGVSYLWDQTEPIEALLERILRQIDAVLYTDLQTGKIKIALAREPSDDDITLAPTFDNDNVIEVVSSTRGALDATSNEVRVTYTDRAAGYIRRGSPLARNLANRQLQGQTKPVTINYPGVSNEAYAIRLAVRDLRALSLPLLRHTIRVDREGSFLVPGQIYKWSDEGEGIENLVMRVTRVRYGGLPRGTVEVEGVEDAFRVGDVPLAVTPGSWTDPAAGDAEDATAAAFEVPYYLQGDDAQRLMAAAARPDDAHKSYDLVVASETRVPHVDFTPSGTLVNNYSEATADVDTSDTLIVEDLTDADELLTATAAEVGEGKTLLVIDNEWLAYRTFTDNGDGTYTFHNVYRGLLDTVPANHAAGARVWFVSIDAALDEEVRAEGTAYACEMLTRTVRDVLTQGEATNHSVTAKRRAGRPYRPSYLEVNSSYTSRTIPATGSVALAWKERNRLSETSVIRQNTTSVAPELGTTYTLKIYNAAGTLIRTEAGLTDPSYTYTNAQETADNGSLSDWLTFALYAVRGTLTSWQAVMRQVARPGAGSAPALPSYTPAGTYVASPVDAQGIQGVPVSATPPSASAPVLIYNPTTGQYEPGAIAGSTAGSDLIDSIVVDPTDLSVAVDPDTLNVLTES